MARIERALREIQNAPCCGQTVQVMLGIPIHDPQSSMLQEVVQCPGCGDYFRTKVFLMTSSEKINLPKAKLELIYG